MQCRLRHIGSLAVTALLLAASAMAGEEVQFRVSLEPPEIPFHERARLIVEAEAPAGMTVNLPDFKDKLDGLILSESPGFSQEAIGEDRVRMRETYVLEAIEVRDYFIPQATLEWGDGQSETTPGLVLRVRDLTDAEREAAERFTAALTIEELPDHRTTWYVATTAAVLLGLGLFALYLRRRNRGDEPATPPPPAWEIALKRLSQLREKNFAQRGDYETFYVHLSSILRWYIEDRYFLHAPEQTTPEFMDAAASTGVISDVRRADLGAFLGHADRVKFARFVPGVEEMSTHFSLVQRFVEDTTPRDEADQSEAA